jgi:hypothetical protein
VEESGDLYVGDGRQLFGDFTVDLWILSQKGLEKLKDLVIRFFFLNISPHLLNEGLNIFHLFISPEWIG